MTDICFRNSQDVDRIVHFLLDLAFLLAGQANSGHMVLIQGQKAYKDRLKLGIRYSQ